MSGMVVWFTGLPASGKSTMARAIHRQLEQLGIAGCILDGDAVRRALSPTPGYDPEAREDFYQTLSQLAALLADQELVVLVPATAHHRRYRGHARQLSEGGSGRHGFLEVYVEASPADCEVRDIKGLYAAARDREIPLPGVTVPYDIPDNPDVIARGGCDRDAIAEVVRRIEGHVVPGVPGQQRIPGSIR